MCRFEINYQFILWSHLIYTSSLFYLIPIPTPYQTSLQATFYLDLFYFRDLLWGPSATPAAVLLPFLRNLQLSRSATWPGGGRLTLLRPPSRRSGCCCSLR